jgi:hypothetical protein
MEGTTQGHELDAWRSQGSRLGRMARTETKAERYFAITNRFRLSTRRMLTGTFVR